MLVHNIAIKELLIKYNEYLKMIISILSSLADNNEVWGYSAGYGIECDHDMTVDVWPLGGKMFPGLFHKIEINESV